MSATERRAQAGGTSRFPQTPSTGPLRGQALHAEPHHDGSELHVLERPDDLGGDAVVRIRTPRGAADTVLLRYTRDGEPRTAAAVVDEQTQAETWWRAKLPMRNPTVRYRWLLTGGDIGYGSLNGIGLSPHEVAGADDFVLTVGDTGPDWHLSSVVYEIFPDRFARSELRPDAPEWAVPREWDAPPTGRGRTTPREWYGGDLRGIEQHLDHVEQLGANVLYLTPFFPGRSTHRYDSTTFETVDPLLGGDEAFRSLARAAHARGMRILGDLTTNHTGDQHAWFRAAVARADAHERSFYYFDESLPHGYEAWLGVPSLPKLDWRSDDLRERIACVVRHWLDEGLDGWRIDVANMTGRYREIDVNAAAARSVRAAADGALLVAEHGHDYRPDLDGHGWHGVMNYAGFLRPTWWWLRGDGTAEDVFSTAPAPRYSGPEAVAVMKQFRAGIPWSTVAQSWTLLDSHDSPRFRTVVGGDAAVQAVGLGMQMTTPGVPMVYAGDELGLEGLWGEDGRRTMPWDSEWDTAFLEQVRRLATLRRSSAALARGGIRYVHVAADAIAYLRESRGERLLVLAARAPHDPISTPFRSLETLYGEDARDGVLPADGPSFHVWRISDG
jgi:alpha-glucosidase